MRIFIWLLAGPLLILALVLFLLWVPLPAPLPPSLDRARNLPVGLATGVLMLAYVAATPVVAVRIFRRPGRRLDAAFVPLGLVPEHYLLWGRAFRGGHGGRGVTIHFLPGLGARRACIEARVTCSPGARLAVGRRRPILDGACRRALEGGPWDPGWIVCAPDEREARALLDDSEFREAVAGVAEFRSAPGEVYLQPDRVWARSYPTDLGEETLRAWLEAVLRLAAASEGNPPRPR